MLILTSAAATGRARKARSPGKEIQAMTPQDAATAAGNTFISAMGMADGEPRDEKRAITINALPAISYEEKHGNLL